MKLVATDPSRVRRFVHGTTVPTNIVLERTGARTGVITTRGFADVLEIGRQMRSHIYELQLDPETPVFLAPGARRVEVDERISSEGNIIHPLRECSVISAVEALIDEGVTSIAVCLLFSFLNPLHERGVGKIIEQRWPNISVSLSCEVDPAFREYERTVVTAFDAYIKPVVRHYLDDLSEELGASGVHVPLQVMQSRGGITAASTAASRPVRLFLSGPAAGVIGGSRAGQAVELTDVITVDIGGTSCDIALVSGGEPLIRSDGQVDGYLVRVPMVDVNAIGAGGGSIAWLDAAGGIRVGPRSAGSEPGPACYGFGGKQATVTDASVVLGFLNPDYFAGGSLSLNPKLAEQVVRDNVAEPLGLSLEDAAWGIHRVVNAQMAEGMRLVSIRQGHDPREFALVALGGAGPVHAIPLAEELSIAKVVIPCHPGVLSAEGLLTAPIEHEVSAGFPRNLEGLEIDEITVVLDGLDQQCAQLMAGEAIDSDRVVVSYSADVCYVGQSHYLAIVFDRENPMLLESIYASFIRVHEQVFGYSTQSPAQIVNIRSVYQFSHTRIDRVVSSLEATGDIIKSERSVMFEQTLRSNVPIYDLSLIHI